MQPIILDERLDPPLCVDLDGTLVRTDTLHESLLSLVRTDPLVLFLLPLWLLSGRAGFKRKVACRVSLDASALPYNQEFLEYLQSCHKAGRKLILVTAADESIARQVADHLGIFSSVLASSPEENLKGDAKRLALVEAFGEGRFDYAGNSRADFAVWNAARRTIVVSNSTAFIAMVRRRRSVEREFHSPGVSPRAILKAIRYKQWVKNVLIFIPAIASHQMFVPAIMVPAAIAFLCFCLTSSSGYLVNDLMDLAADRIHPEKKLRPFAAGLLAPWIGIALLLLFLTTAAVVAGLLLPAAFAAALAGYLIVTVAYSLYLKKQLLLDVVVLAGLYSLRVFAGGAATGVFLSPWLVAFSIFLFLSLALVKRVSELQGLSKAGKSLTSRRAYSVDDLQPLSIMGMSSGYISCFILALYMNSPEVIRQYHNPRWLWMICPIALYWISRMWLLAHRGEVNEDPVLFATRDRASYFLLLFAAAVFALAI